MDGHVQARLFTKQLEYTIPDREISIPLTATAVEITSFVKSLLEGSGSGSSKNVEFEFLVFGELLRCSMKEKLETSGVSQDSVLEIEYFTKFPAPFLKNSLIHDDWVSAVKSAGNWILSGCYDNTLHLWDVYGKHKLTIPGHVAPVKSVAWIEVGSPISTFVSTSHDETAMLWQWNQFSNSVDCVHVCKGHSRSVDCVDVNKNQNLFATGSYDQMLKVWSSDLLDSYEDDSGDADYSRKRQRTESGKSRIKTPIMTLSGHNDGISGVQWMDTNEMCSSSMDSTIKFWDVDLQSLKMQINGTKAFLDISFSLTSRMLLSAAADRHVRLWDLRSKGDIAIKLVFTSHTGWVTAVKWCPYDMFKFITSSHDSMIKMWDTRSTKVPLYNICEHEDKVYAVDWSPQNYIVSGGADNYVKVLKVQNSAVEAKAE